MKTIKVTQADKIGWFRAAAILQIMDMLEWDEAMYAGMVYRLGVEYLNRMFPKADDCKLLEASNEFWGWWKLSWYIRDQEWLRQAEISRKRFMVVRSNGQLAVMNMLAIEGYNPFANAEAMRGSYQDMHDIEELVECMELDNSYCRDLVPALRKSR